MRYNPGWSSYLPILIKVFQQSKGDVLELGAGVFSTPLLHWLCLDWKRNLVTYENNPEYFELHKKFRSSSHQINFVTDWDYIDIDRKWGLAFIDHEPSERRKVEAIRLKDKADFVVIHDTNPQDEHKYRFISEVFPHYKYRYDYKRKFPYTTVLSNFVDLKKL